ncbi:ZIP family metal transporter [Parvibium lacunae]|uniref:ZIP family metal transporter n=1 Tax=Parvibium lacunae TaxID=1888893 RepID=A0A368L3F4_9BURK|nr:ZIP family metal transporter [Parvibium lacunae]RCS58126.1 ZIP family metal transporter [Parvibium lacunae]
MPLILQIVSACLLGGVLSLLAAGCVIAGLSRRWLSYAVSFSTGILLATAMLHLLPEALSSGLTPHEGFPVLLGGVLGFFILEKLALWRHAQPHSGPGTALLHEEDRSLPHHLAESAPVSILIGDGFHNFTDGLLIAAAFLTDPALGWTTAVAVIAHEIPQEAGDFAILLAAGWGYKRALFWNALSSLASVVGGLAGYIALEQIQDWVPYVIILAAASFLYISIADLLPRLKSQWQGLGWHGLLLGAGVAISVL